MSSHSNIEWTDATWNPVTGCDKVSQGCKNCYAEAWANRGMGEWSKDYKRKFTDIRLHEDKLDIPLHWKKPRRIFVTSMSDLFHEEVDALFIGRVFEVIHRATWHTFQILTKRPERMMEYMQIEYFDELPPRNLWLGVSCEDQRTADERIPLLIETPAAVHFISCEPLLGPVDLHFPKQPNPNPNDTWVIVGGESGPGARPMHPDWARSLRDQCNNAGVPFFFKQWGNWVERDSERIWKEPCQRIGLMSGAPWFHHHMSGVGGYMFNLGKKRAGRALDGCEWNEYPTLTPTRDAELVALQGGKIST